MRGLAPGLARARLGAAHRLRVMNRFSRWTWWQRTSLPAATAAADGVDRAGAVGQLEGEQQTRTRFEALLEATLEAG